MQPWPAHWTLKALAGLWSLPVAILGFLVALVLLAVRQIESCGWNDGAWDLLVRKGSGLYRQTSGVWGGWSLGWCVFYTTEDEYKDKGTRDHERVHLRQQLILGLLHWIFYGVFCVVVWLSCRSLHAYKANPFELDARRKCGQPIGDLGPEQGNDRWPWW